MHLRVPWRPFGLENILVQSFGLGPESHHTPQALGKDGLRRQRLVNWL